jgi:hypothetical protein
MKKLLACLLVLVFISVIVSTIFAASPDQIIVNPGKGASVQIVFGPENPPPSVMVKTPYGIKPPGHAATILIFPLLFPLPILP